MRAARSHLRSLVVLLAAVGVLVAAVIGGGDGSARAAVGRATGPLVATSAGNAAILSASNLAPGLSRAGEVTVTNVGDSPGAFAMTASRPVDSSTAARLSSVLSLRIADVTAGRPASVLYSGRLADLARIGLGRFAQGAVRRYRFTVALPGGRPPAADDPFQGRSTTVTFTWAAIGASAPAGGASGPGADAPTAAHTAQSPGTATTRYWRLRFKASKRQVPATAASPRPCAAGPAGG
jgi:hypothetical protein